MDMQTEPQPLAARTLHDKLSALGDNHTYNPSSCEQFSREIAAIRKLKKQRNAVILAHNYQRPEIFEVADFIGDSLELSRQAAKVDVDIIVFCGVHFMAETAKILNPSKTVLLPDLRAGCSLADSASAESLVDRKTELRRVFPDLAVVSYVNTTAEVKAESDVCCTSANAVKIVNALPNQNIPFVPDQNLARHVQENSGKNIIAWDGNCYVHHQITPDQISEIREALPHVRVLAHPECRQDVLALADAVLSTSGMVEYARNSGANEFLVVTECGLSDRLTLELPEKKFYRACKLCHFMKMITLSDTLTALRETRHEIQLNEAVRLRAEKALQRMLELS
jgi:quinolinate synthase